MLYQWRDVCWTAVRLDPDGNSLIVSGNLFAADQLREAWLDFLKRTASEKFLSRLRFLSANMGREFDFKSMAVRVQKGRWGSCSSRKTISLNAMLLLVDPDLADAVMYHELCHLREMNHSERFYALLYKYCPDWQTKRKLLAAQQKQFPPCFR